MLTPDKDDCDCARGFYPEPKPGEPKRPHAVWCRVEQVKRGRSEERG
jgi:hypothetical protein